MNIKHIGVVGAGQMGAGIAQVASQSGYTVTVSDMSDAALERGRAQITASLDKLVKKALVSDSERENILHRISWHTQIVSHKNADFVIEAVSENEHLKGKIIRELDECLDSRAVIASNTSSISITRLAAFSKRADRFIGMHFMNPVPVMKLVEVISGLQTSNATLLSTCTLAQKMGKTTTQSRDYPGFIANRILMPMINEAFFAVMEGVATAEDIDITMKLGANHPMGPLQLADFIGLDTCLAIMQVLCEGMGDSKYRPCPLLRQYVDAGMLGRKSGRGVFNYS